MRLLIVGIFRRETFHRISIGEQTRLLWRALEVAVQTGNGRDVPSFALRFCASDLAPRGALASRL